MPSLDLPVVPRALRQCLLWRVGVVAFVSMIVPVYTQAQLIATWSGGSNTIWSDGANWVGGSAPNAGTSVLIDTNRIFQPVLAEGSLGSSIQNLIVGNVTGGGGFPINPELTIDSGLLSAASVTLGNEAGSDGILLVNGTLAKFKSTGLFLVGNSGTGNLSIANGGNVTSANAMIGNLAGSTGSASVDGSDTQWNLAESSLIIGQLGNGTLSITNGGNVTSENGTIGNQTGANNSVSVDGAGSVWFLAFPIGSNHDLSVGGSDSGVFNLTNDPQGLANGSLSITNGGNVTTSGNVNIATYRQANGSVVVDGVGSVLSIVNNFNSELNVGVAGNGSLTISNGGSVSGAGSVIVGNQTGSNGTLTIANGGILSVTNEVVLGNAVGSNGTLTISGSGSALTALHPSTSSPTVIVGFQGSGILNVGGGANLTANLAVGVNGIVNQDGGTVTATESFRGVQINGTYNLDSGTLNLGSNQITGRGALNLAGGTLQVSNGTVAFNATLVADTTSTISSNATGLGSFFVGESNTGTIRGSGNLEVSGNEATELIGNNTYTGATIVNGTPLDVLTLANGGAASVM